MRLNRVRTPCIGVCSTGIGDEVCRGCKRFAHEVVGWNGFSEEQRRIIDRRLADFLARCVANHIVVIDAGLLRAQLELQQIRFDPTHDPHCWVFALLKAGATQITDTAAFGFEVLRHSAQITLKSLREEIDRDFYMLSEAHHERYYRLPQTGTSA